MRERGMLCFDTIERRLGPRDFWTEHPEVPQLWLGDDLLANNFVSMDWWHEPVQFTVCACGYPGCVGGDYLSLRRTGDLVIFLPAFALWEDDFGLVEYMEPSLMEGLCAGFMHKDRYEDLRSFGTGMPSFEGLEELSYGEGLALWYFEAPPALRTRDFREIAHALAVRRDLSAAAGAGLIGLDRSAILCTSGEDEDAVLKLLRQAVLSAHGAPKSSVELSMADAEKSVTIYLDVPGFQEWPALALRNGRWCALLAPNFSFELDPSIGS